MSQLYSKHFICVTKVYTNHINNTITTFNQRVCLDVSSIFSISETSSGAAYIEFTDDNRSNIHTAETYDTVIKTLQSF